MTLPLVLVKDGDVLPVEYDYDYSKLSESNASSQSDVLKDDELAKAEEGKTLWREVIFAGLVSFLAAVENSVLGISEWPYMRTLDPKATADFFGVASAVSKGAHAIFAVVFTCICYRLHSVKLPLLVGRVICVLACILYILVGEFPTNRRFVLLTCYLLFGIGASAAVVLRAYVVAISTSTDRARAIAVLTLATILSIVIGPIVQMAFSGIDYPGKHMFGNTHFNVYTAPVWFAFATNFVSVPVIIWGIKELPADAHNPDEASVFTWSGFKEKLALVRKSNFDWVLVVLCWVMKFTMAVSSGTFLSLMSIMVMVQYGWSGQKSIRILSATLGGVGVLSIIVLGLYMLIRVSRVIPQRYLFLLSMLLSTIVFWVTHPWSFLGEPVAEFNATTLGGCSPRQYDWCDHAYGVYPAMLLTSLVVIYGFGVPTGFVALDTIYSKILGDIDQNLMQGAIIVADDISNIITPIYTTNMFTNYGVATLWYANGSFFAVMTLVWIVFIPRLRRVA